MASEFSTEFFSANRIVKADLRAARTPREEDLERIKKEVAKLYDATEVILNVTVDDSLLSGYVLQIGDRVFDNSAIFSLYFDLFDGLIQTYVFVFLTSLFMKESIGGEE